MQRLLAQAAGAALSPSCRERFARHVMSNLVCLGRHTLSGILCTGGRAQYDWTADYRLYNQDRVVVERLFEVVGKEVLQKCVGVQPLVCALDDSMLRKSGKKISA
jgi:hypothetical protein